ncbi:hypothetical protein U472_00345 [Orenia metallireducens]|uniref:Phage recombination protein Bet n=1 Tax=Orenia metallireducens TaxID=1413210 RepID=A0A1C0ADD0_9FIRM|nr:RecT family recombinase [Orenia metallireducens]OCL28640.1 hypothetical protein U472_00345 [Orenia metallireducens]
MNNVVEMNSQVADNSLIKSLEEKKDVIKRTVAKGANNDEFEMFMHLAKQYGLDPFQKEIFFWKYGSDPTIMTSRDGYLKIANNHPQFDGHVADVVHENDSFEKLMDGVKHTYNLKNRGKIIGAYCLVYRKDRKFPVYVFAPYEEYKKSSQVWRQYASAMILKCAESMALKRAFSVSGLVSREEIGYEDNQNTTRMSSEEVSNLEEGLKNKPARNENKQAKQEIINRLAKAVESEENNITGEAIKSVAKSNFGTGNLAKLDLEQLEELEQIFLFETYFGDEEETEENKVVDVEAEVVENDEENFGAEVERAVAEG